MIYFIFNNDHKRKGNESVSSEALSAASKEIKLQYSMKDIVFGYFSLTQESNISLGSVVYTILVNQVKQNDNVLLFNV